MNPIVRGFRNLSRFSGRDGRGEFWPYAGLIIALGFAAIFVVMVGQTQALMTDMQTFAAAHPERVTTEVGSSGYSMSISAGDPAFVPDMDGAFMGIGAVVAVMIGLLSAAVARRLHDTGRSGLWAVPAPVFLICALVLMPRLMATFTGPAPDLTLFGLLFANNMAYLVSLGGLVVLLILPGKPGPNRFGPPTA